MRIGYEFLLPGKHDTGVEIAIRQLLAAIGAQNKDNSIHAIATPRNERRLPPSIDVTRWRPVLPRMGRLGRAAWQQLIAPFTLRSLDLDVYHATGYVASPHLPVATVISLYDVVALEHPELTHRLNALHYRWTVLRGLRRAARVLVPSQYVRDRLLSRCQISQDRVEVIPLGVSSHIRRLSQEEAEAHLASLPEISGQPFLLFVGNLEPKKNLAVLISALARVRRATKRNLKLVLAGKRTIGARTLEIHAAKEGVSQHILLPGYVSEDMLNALYTRAEMLVYPALEEGFGLPPLEAMRCGTPVVASNSGALPETTGGAALLVPPNDPDVLARAIIHLLECEDRRAALRERGTAWAGDFTWERCARSVLGVYREVAQEHPRRAVIVEPAS